MTTKETIEIVMDLLRCGEIDRQTTNAEVLRLVEDRGTRLIDILTPSPEMPFDMLP